MTWNGYYWVAANRAFIDYEGAQWIALAPVSADRMVNTKRGTREECIAWLDRKMLAAQAAVMPPGGVIVRPDDPALRERLIDAVLAALKPPAPECDGGKP